MVTDDEINEASDQIPKELKSAIQLSHDRVAAYHKKQMPKDLMYQDDLGIELGFIWNSIESAGVYVPGGTASYPSSVIMNTCLLYTSPSPRDATLSRMPSSA